MPCSGFLLFEGQKKKKKKQQTAMTERSSIQGEMKQPREGLGNTQACFFLSSSLFLWLRVNFIAVAKSAYDLGLQQLFTPIDIPINQSGSGA